VTRCDLSETLPTHTKAEQAALEEGVSVFSTVIKDPMSGERGEKFLKEISRMTGGFSTDKSLKQAVSMLLTAIKAQWVVTLHSTQSVDRNLHSMEVKCTQKDVRISAPSGVIAQQDARPGGQASASKPHVSDFALIAIA
jgi:hypothetical protein